MPHPTLTRSVAASLLMIALSGVAASAQDGDTLEISGTFGERHGAIEIGLQCDPRQLDLLARGDDGTR